MHTVCTSFIGIAGPWHSNGQWTAGSCSKDCVLKDIDNMFHSRTN